MRRGALAEAEADTRAALELSAEHNLTLAVLVHAAYLGLTLLERGGVSLQLCKPRMDQDRPL